MGKGDDRKSFVMVMKKRRSRQPRDNLKQSLHVADQLQPSSRINWRSSSSSSSSSSGGGGSGGCFR